MACPMFPACPTQPCQLARWRWGGGYVAMRWFRPISSSDFRMVFANIAEQRSERRQPATALGRE
eukprot:9958401-Lingulodinium_polyedra.AAC.1